MKRADRRYHYKTEPPENDDFEIGQLVFCEDEIFRIESISCDWLFDVRGRQYNPESCEVIISTNDPDIDL